MAKTAAPLLSFTASGQIGNAQVYGSWRGVQYARRYVVPANPRTTAQQETRGVFRTLSAMFLTSPGLVRAPWFLAAQGRPLTDRNLFIGQNLRVVREEEDLENFIASPGAKGGLPPTSMTVVPGDTQLTVQIAAPPTPVGWTLEAVVAAAFLDQAPDATWVGTWHAGEDTSDPDEVLLEGLTNTETYIVSGWTRWTKADGRPAYGPSLVATGVPAS